LGVAGSVVAVTEITGAGGGAAGAADAEAPIGAGSRMVERRRGGSCDGAASTGA
jgi:hypothetical protein